MRFRLPLAFLALLAAASAAAAATAAGAATPRYGTVSHGWLSVKRSGPATVRLPVGAGQLVAQFQWERAPSSGLPLEIDWKDSSNTLRAVWKSKTLASDKAGTILWTSVLRKTLIQSRGRWHVELLVDGRVRGYLRFTVPS
jgi:hypothetical protein